MKLINKICLCTLTATTILAGGFIAPASQAQKVVNINPTSNNENVSPDTSISGVFEVSEGLAVNSQSIKIYLDNNDITRNSTITENFFSYKPSKPLAPGLHVVKIEYENIQGEEKVVSWSFKVEKTSADLEIFSITHNATEPLGKKSTFLATIKGTPGAKANILLFQNGGKLIEIPANEVSEGVYVGTYNVDIKSSSNEGIVVGRLVSKGEKIYDAATQGFIFNNQEQSTEAPPVTVKPKRRLKPVITNYEDGDKVSSNGFTLEGRTQPNAIVEVEVASKVPVLSGFINIDLGARTFFEDRVTADDQGNFVVNVPGLSERTPGMKYNITMSASNQQKRSNPVKLTLTQE